mmetsp:Transcript_10916/g.26049  ORF Transcript_10916/g.26049 Transcript_10916/m.26049 type:complete len:563 (+) Transcript_10916:112-1800(+)
MMKLRRNRRTDSEASERNENMKNHRRFACINLRLSLKPKKTKKIDQPSTKSTSVLKKTTVVTPTEILVPCTKRTKARILGSSVSSSSSSAVVPVAIPASSNVSSVSTNQQKTNCRRVYRRSKSSPDRVETDASSSLAVSSKTRVSGDTVRDVAVVATPKVTRIKNDQSFKAPCTRQEIQWAKQLKNEWLANHRRRHIDNDTSSPHMTISDFEYLQHAIIAKGRLDKALGRLRHLHEFKRRCGMTMMMQKVHHQGENNSVESKIQDAQRTLNKYFSECNTKRDGNILSVGRNIITGIHIVCADGGGNSSDEKFSDKTKDCAHVRLDQNEKSNGSITLRAIYYLLQAIQYDVPSVRAGVSFLVDCERIGWKDMSQFFSGTPKESAENESSSTSSGNSLLSSLHQLFAATKSTPQRPSFFFSSGSALVPSSSSSSYPLRINRISFLNVCPIVGALFDICQLSFLSAKMRKTLTVVVRGGGTGGEVDGCQSMSMREHGGQENGMKMPKNNSKMKKYLAKHPDDFPITTLPTCWGGSLRNNEIVPTILEKLVLRYELEKSFRLSDYK